MVQETNKIEYRATYWPKDQNPFAPHIRFRTMVARVDASMPFEEVERLAREAGGNARFLRVEAVT